MVAPTNSGSCAHTSGRYLHIEKKAHLRLFSMVKENGGQGRRGGIFRAGFRPCRRRRSGACAAGTTVFRPRLYDSIGAARNSADFAAHENFSANLSEEFDKRAEIRPLACVG